MEYRLIVHYVVPQRKLKVVDQFTDTKALCLGDSITMFPGKVGTESHTSCNSVSVQHTSWKFVSWRPSMSEGMRSALVGLPKITKLGTNVRFHSQSNDTFAVSI